MIDQAVADFTLPATSGQIFQLVRRPSGPLVIYFYPKDSTPGCTTEAAQFRDLYPEFQKLACAIVGISRDSLRSHENFKAKLQLPFELLSDSEEFACQQFGVIRQKKLYGKDVRGIERSSFLLDANNVLRREWRGVKVDGHAASVLAALKELPGKAG